MIRSGAATLGGNSVYARAANDPSVFTIMEKMSAFTFKILLTFSLLLPVRRYIDMVFVDEGRHIKTDNQNIW